MIDTREMAQLENALMCQKDLLILDINASHGSPDKLRLCLAKLEAMLPVWHAVGYSYKGRELAARIFVEASNGKGNEERYLEAKGTRATSKTARDTKDRIGQLNLILERAHVIEQECRRLETERNKRSA